MALLPATIRLCCSPRARASAALHGLTFMALAISICGAWPAGAEPLRVPTIDELLGADHPGSAKLSPDGRFVVYSVERADWEANSQTGELWVADTTRGERRRLTSTGKWDGAPRWSPDGKRIAFLSSRGGSVQIYLIGMSGGEAVALTSVNNGIAAFRWSPDGRHIAFTMTDPEGEEAALRRKRYGDFEVIEKGREESGGRSHLWLLEVPGPSSRNAPPQPARLTGGKNFSVNSFEWSPDGARIAFDAVADPSPRARSTADIYTLDLATRNVRKIVDTPGPDVGPVWSPDGRQIAYETANGRLNYFETNTYIAAVPATGGAPRLLTGKIDEQAILLYWGPKAIYFALQQKTALHLFRLDPLSRNYTRISTPDNFVAWQYSFSDDYERACFTSATATSYPEIYVADLKRFRPKRITAFNDQFKGRAVAAREVISWTSTDGTRVEGVLVKPADFDPARKYPLLVLVHGGPAAVYRPVQGIYDPYPVEQLVAKGALVLEPNYRGSTGYGEAFRAPDPRSLSDYEDVLTGVKHLVDRGVADRERIGVMGWSQGGYLAALLATKGSNWFRAASVGGSVPNWLTYYTSGDAGYWAAQWFKATPLQDPEAYRLKSPISYLADAGTPVLIQHGEFDRRAPIAGAYEFYRMLEERDVPVRMIVYRGAGHVIGSPKGMRALMEHNYNWFSRWIWGAREETR